MQCSFTVVWPPRPRRVGSSARQAGQDALWGLSLSLCAQRGGHLLPCPWPRWPGALSGLGRLERPAQPARPYACLDQEMETFFFFFFVAAQC